MICGNCGMSVRRTAKFCSGCGASITSGRSGTIPDATTGSAIRPSPVSALFTEPPPRPTSSVTCVIHAFANAAGTCVSYGKHDCSDCLVMHAGRNYCRNCATRLSGSTGSEHAAVSTGAPEPYQYSQQVVPSGSQPQGNPYVELGTPYVKRKEPSVALLRKLFLSGLRLNS
jgi:zinc ribbon protein